MHLQRNFLENIKSGTRKSWLVLLLQVVINQYVLMKDMLIKTNKRLSFQNHKLFLNIGENGKETIIAGIFKATVEIPRL